MSRGVSLIAILYIDTEGLPFVINYFVYVCKEVMRILVRGIKRQITPTGKGRDSIQKYKIWRQRFWVVNGVHFLADFDIQSQYLTGYI